MNVEVEIFPLFDDAYVRSLSDGNRSRHAVARHYFRRIRTLTELTGYDVLWVEYELLPWIPWLVEARFLPKGLPLVVDYDDAIFHKYDRHQSALVRWLLGRKIDRVMASATTVVAGNHYLADRASAAGARLVEVLPTVVDLERYHVADQEENSHALSVGWIGSPSTARYLDRLQTVAESIARSHGAKFFAVGAPPNLCSPPFIARDWSEETEVDQLRSFTIGIMPLVDQHWERGKCGYKLIQYMACGLPVVASPVGVNSEIVRHGVDGFLASNDEDWTRAIDQLLANPALRADMGRAGRARIAERYSLDGHAPRLAAILREAAEAGPRRANPRRRTRPNE
jgi:glycosyltransferase involved in cell wall biosynthesis